MPNQEVVCRSGVFMAGDADVFSLMNGRLGSVTEIMMAMGRDTRKGEKRTGRTLM
jgi:hypothetical protein